MAPWWDLELQDTPPGAAGISIRSEDDHVLKAAPAIALASGMIGAALSGLGLGVLVLDPPVVFPVRLAIILFLVAPLPLGVLALVLGRLSRQKGRRLGTPARAMAMGGVVVGLLAILLWVATWAFGLIITEALDGLLGEPQSPSSVVR